MPGIPQDAGDEAILGLTSGFRRGEGQPIANGLAQFKDLIEKIFAPGKAKGPGLSGYAPKLSDRLPRIVPDGKGNLIDLNTNKIVGRE